MRFSSDVLPRQPLTCAQPVMPGLDLVPQHVLRDAVLELLDEIGTLRPRPDDRHVAAQHVPELRQLVEIEAPQPAPDRRAARVVRRAPRRAGFVLGALVHRAELVDLERLAVEPHALLRVEHRTGRRAPDQRRDDEQAGCRQDEQRRAGNRDVDRPLEHAVEAAQRNVVQADDRNAVEVFEARAQRDELQQVRDDVDVDAFAVGRLDERRAS